MTRSRWITLLALAFAASTALAQQSTALRWAAAQASTQGAMHSSDARVQALRDATLSTQVTGAIVQLTVHAGEHVKAGQALARIDARLASQSAAASQAQVAAAQAQAALAGRQWERQQQLFAKNYISQAALESARAQWQASQAQVKALQAQAGAAATQSGLHVLHAPFDGVVTSVPVALGDMALPGKPILTLIDPAALRVTAQLTQAQAAQMQAPGAKVEVELAGRRLTPTTLQVLPTADAQSHTVTLRAGLPADLPGALPGAFARLWWQGGEAAGEPPRIFVPAQAVVRRSELAGVYVQGADGKPRLRQVRLGQAQGEMTEILAGVRAGEQVALDPQAAARVR